MELLPPIKYIFEFLAYGCSFFSIIFSVDLVLKEIHIIQHFLKKGKILHIQSKPVFSNTGVFLTYRFFLTNFIPLICKKSHFVLIFIGFF